MLSNPLADPSETRQVASTGPCPQSALYQDLLVMAYRGTTKEEIGKEDKMMCSVQEPQTSSFVLLDTDKQLNQTSSELNGDLGSNTNFKAGTDEGNGFFFKEVLEQLQNIVFFSIDSVAQLST